MSRAFSRRIFHNSATLVQRVQAGFGLTLQSVADLLGVSRAKVAMDGQPGRPGGPLRSMPAPAAIGLLAMWQTVPKPYGPALEPPAADLFLHEHARKNLQFRLRGIRIADYPLEQQQERLQTRLSQAQARLQALPALRAAFPEERAQRWLTLFEQEAHAWLEYDRSALLQLTLRRKVLAYEAAEIRQLLGEPEEASLVTPVAR